MSFVDDTSNRKLCIVRAGHAFTVLKLVSGKRQPHAVILLTHHLAERWIFAAQRAKPRRRRMMKKKKKEQGRRKDEEGGEGGKRKRFKHCAPPLVELTGGEVPVEQQ